MRVNPVPERLVDPDGRIHLGVFDKPCANPDFSPAGGRLRRKVWQHYLIILPEVSLAVAIVDVGYLRNAWVFVVDRTSGTQTEHEALAPWLDAHVSASIGEGRAHVRASGLEVVFENHDDRGEHRLTVRANRPNKAPVSADLLLKRLPDDERIVAVLGLGQPQRALYTVKALFTVEGQVKVGATIADADPRTALALLDVHHALYPWRTHWNWATLAGRDPSGRAVAMNLTRNANPDDARENENGIWLDGRLSRVGPASFDLDPKDVLKPWRLKSSCGAVDLTFSPQGERFGRVELGVIQSAFHQPYGTFAGVLLAGTERLRVDGMFGVCEDHHARW